MVYDYMFNGDYDNTIYAKHKSVSNVSAKLQKTQVNIANGAEMLAGSNLQKNILQLSSAKGMPSYEMGNKAYLAL